MIRSIAIGNFRGIRHGVLEHLSPLTVFVGPNSAGKSTILDAMLIGVAENNGNAVLPIVTARRAGMENTPAWLLFREKNNETQFAEIIIRTDSPHRRVVTLRRQGFQVSATASFMKNGESDEQDKLSPAGLFKNAHVTGSPEDVREIRLIEGNVSKNQRPLHDLYTIVAERGLRREAKAIVTDLLPNVEDIEILTQNGAPTVYLVYKNGAQPLGLAGEGVQHLLRQSLELAAPAGGTILLEGPEVHMHPGAIRQSARAMLAAMGRGVQVIVTTHSLDLIDFLLAEVAPDQLDRLSFYRLQLKDGELRSYRHSGSEASLARSQIQEDLR